MEAIFTSTSSTEMAAGATAGLAEHLVMFPFDTIKTRMQDRGSLLQGVRHSIREIYTREGFRAFFHGWVPTITAAVPSHAAYFSAYEAAKRHFGDTTTLNVIAASACATTAHDVVSTPFDVVKQRMQNKSAPHSTLRCIAHIFKTSGFKAFFSSLPTTIAMNLPHGATHWVVYEAVKVVLQEGDDMEQNSPGHFMLAGACAGACAATASSPLDVVRTRIQLGHSMSFLAGFQAVVRERGAAGLWRGVVPRIMYIAPSAAIVMTTYETTKSVLALLVKQDQDQRNALALPSSQAPTVPATPGTTTASIVVATAPARQ